jgi:predicted DNA-binding WGR domain protein
VTAFTVDTPKAAHIVGMSNHIEATVRELDFVQGTSDKFYRVFTLGTTMVVQYGRNGTFGSISSKEFDAAAAATKAADKQVAAKMAKGYQPVRSGVLTFDHDPTDNELDTAANLMPRGESTVVMPAQREPSAVVTATNSAPADEAHAATFAKVLAALDASNAATLPVDANPPASIPMLARVVTLTTVDRLMEDGMWVVQPKLDGERVLIEVTDGAVSVLNRAGQPKAKNVSEAMLAPFRALTEGRWVFDGEIIGRTVHLFDMAAAGRFVTERSGFTTRHANLVTIVDALVDPSDPRCGCSATPRIPTRSATCWTARRSTARRASSSGTSPPPTSRATARRACSNGSSCTRLTPRSFRSARAARPTRSSRSTTTTASRSSSARFRRSVEVGS